MFSTKVALSISTSLGAAQRESTLAPFPRPDQRADDQHFRLYQDLSAKPLTDLMQNVTLDLYAYPDPAALRCANSLLHCFSDPTIPRIRCTVFLWPDSDQFLSQVSFLDSLGKLAGFRTVLLIHFGEMNIIQGPTFKTLDEYLSVTLGPGEPSFGVHDWRFKRCHCLTYHPGRHACGVQGKEITDRGVLSTMVSMFLD